MSRSRYVGLERSETTVARGRTGRLVERRADVEEQLQTALAAGDRQRVSELRLLLEDVAAEEVPARARRVDW